MRLEFLRIAAIRNRIAAQWVSRNFRRFSRWMTIGIDAAANQGSIQGAANAAKRTGGGNGVLLAIGGDDPHLFGPL